MCTECTMFITLFQFPVLILFSFSYDQFPSKSLVRVALMEHVMKDGISTVLLEGLFFPLDSLEEVVGQTNSEAGTGPRNCELLCNALFCVS